MPRVCAAGVSVIYEPDTGLITRPGSDSELNPTTDGSELIKHEPRRDDLCREPGGQMIF